MSYGSALLGVPRSTNQFDDVVGLGDACPYWCAPGLPPPVTRLREQGSNCAGLINLMLRATERDPTVVCRYAVECGEPPLGDTRNWFSYLTHRSCLDVFCEAETYPAGTLLLRDYNERDGGHLAVVFAPRPNLSILHARVLHSVGWNDGGAMGVRIDEGVGKSHFHQYNGGCNRGHYTHVCAPHDWLLKDDPR